MVDGWRLEAGGLKVPEVSVGGGKASPLGPMVDFAGEEPIIKNPPLQA